MSYDPFAEIRCRECGWVHYRELPCPRMSAASFGFWLASRLHKLAADIAAWRHLTLAEAVERVHR